MSFIHYQSIPITCSLALSVVTYLSFSKQSADPLTTLLKKANAIETVNYETLEFIQSHTGYEVITKNSFHLKTTSEMNLRVLVIMMSVVICSLSFLCIFCT